MQFSLAVPFADSDCTAKNLRNINPESRTGFEQEQCILSDMQKLCVYEYCLVSASHVQAHAAPEPDRSVDTS